MTDAVRIAISLALIAAANVVGVGQELTSERSNLRAHFRFKDGKVFVAERFESWERSNSSFFYSLRESGGIVEVNIGDDGSANGNHGSFILEIPLDRMKSIRTLPKPKSDSVSWSLVEMQLKDGSIVSGRLRGEGWTGRTKSTDGLYQQVTLKQEAIKSASLELANKDGVNLVIDEANGMKTVLSNPKFDIGRIPPGAGDKTSDEIRVGADDNRLTLIPINRIVRISPTGDGAGNVVVQLNSGKSLEAPLRSGIYASGLLRYGKTHELSAQLWIESGDINVFEEIVFAEPGRFPATADSTLSWKWPGKNSATLGPSARSKATVTPTRTQKKDPKEREKKAEAKLKLAKNLLRSNKSAAKKRLEEILNDFDGTDAASEAKKLLSQE